MSYRAVIVGACEHDGMAFEMHLEDRDRWPDEIGLLNAGGVEITYPLLKTEPVPFEAGRNEHLLLTATYGPKGET